MENINLIRKIAWSFHHSTGMEWDDLFQEAALAYFEGLKTYDSGKGRITTHMWHCISSRLKNYVKEEARQSQFVIPFEELNESDYFLYDSPSFFDRLTDEAREIANLIFSAPKKFIYLDTEQVEETIKNILLDAGWPVEKIHFGLADLKRVCVC